MEGTVHGLLSACHMGLDLEKRNEGKHRNCNSQTRSRLNQFFSQALFREFLADSSIWSRAFNWMNLYWGESGDCDPGHIAMKLWMIARKFK